MEKDSFLAPDFTCVDLICFASYTCWLGENLPNYDDIRNSEGYKNLFFFNSLPNYAISSMQFVTEAQG
jgi:dipeptidyl-peptidase-3